MVENKQPRRRGRPLAFDPAHALDRATDLFWRYGFEGTDLASVAAAAGVTKPSLYGQFGDKASLYLRALEHYGATVGSAPVAAFQAEPDIRAAVGAFLRTAIAGNTQTGRPSGCLLACVAAASAETMPDARAFYRGVLEGAETVFSERFRSEIEGGALPTSFDARGRARLMVDLMQSAALRARAGETRDVLVAGVPSQVDLVLSA